MSVALMLSAGPSFALPNCASDQPENYHNCFATYTDIIDGSIYAGEWKDGLFNGQGVLTFTDRSKYIGEFKDNKYHGQGKYIQKEGTSFEYELEGIWEESNFLYASPADFDKGMDAFFVGKWVLAVKELKLHALNGNPMAQTALGNIYSNGGNRIDKDENQAFVFYQLAAEQGMSNAQYNLAAAYGFGRGVTQNHEMAEYWYLKCGEQEPLADDLTPIMCRHFLANMYYHGDHIAQNYEKAMLWFKKASELKSQNSMKNIGVMYTKGEGVIQDYVIAHMWFNLASSLGDEDSKKYRDMVSENMSVSDVSKAQELARICIKNNYKNCDY